MKKDIDTLKAIPIDSVAASLGIELVKIGSGVYAMKDPENPKEPTSVRFFTRTNTWKRFSGKGLGNSDISKGTNIDLVMALRGCDVKDAIDYLSSL